MAGHCNGNCGCGCQCGSGCNRDTNYAGDMKKLLAPILSEIEKNTALHEKNTALLESIRGEMRRSNHNKQEVKRLGDGKNNNNPMCFVVVALRATCWNTGENKYGRLKEEIVEFTSVLVGAATGYTKFTFHQFVTPTENRWLSEYCKNYNGIKQEDVDINYGAMSLDKALKKHEAWIRRLTNGNCAAAVVVTWGDWACGTMLKQECYRKKLNIPDYFRRWIDLRIPFAQKYGYDYSKINWNDVLEATGLEWEGPLKGGESLAHNQALLLSLLIHEGAKLAITSRLGPWGPN